MMEDNKLSFEEAKARLDEIVSKLQSGKDSLDEMVRLYEQGAELSAYCLKLLDGYADRVEAVDQKAATAEE